VIGKRSREDSFGFVRIGRRWKMWWSGRAVSCVVLSVLLAGTVSRRCSALTTSITVSPGANTPIVIPQGDMGTAPTPGAPKQHTITATPASGWEFVPSSAAATTVPGSLVNWPTATATRTSATYVGRPLATATADTVWTVSTLRGQLRRPAGPGPGTPPAPKAFTVPVFQAALDIDTFTAPVLLGRVNATVAGTSGRPGGNLFDGTIEDDAGNEQDTFSVNPTPSPRWSVTRNFLNGSVAGPGAILRAFAKYNPGYPIVVIANDLFVLRIP